MAKKPIEKPKKDKEKNQRETASLASPMVKITIAVLFFIIGILTVLGIFHAGGAVGNFLYTKFALGLFGYGGIIIPCLWIYAAITLLFPDRFMPHVLDIGIGAFIVATTTGMLELLVPSLSLGGLLGQGIGTLVMNLFSRFGGFIVLFLVTILAILFLFRNSFNSIDWLSSWFTVPEPSEYDYDDDEYADQDSDQQDEEIVLEPTKSNENAFETSLQAAEKTSKKEKQIPEKEEPTDMSVEPIQFSDEYTLPPLSLLSKSAGKPSVGDIRARGNVIKQTLANFGIDVEMDEVDRKSVV